MGDWRDSFTATMQAMFVLEVLDSGEDNGVKYLTLGTSNNLIDVSQYGDSVWGILDDEILDTPVFVSSLDDAVWLSEVLLMGGVVGG
jgi:hypothetical protein